MKKVIVVWFSCGAASAVAAKMTIDIFGKEFDVIVANTGIEEEDSDNRRFLRDVEKWIGQKVITVRNKDLLTDSAVAVWQKSKYMSGIKGAPCTKQLKKEARYQYEKKNKIDWHVLGFTFDEINRHKEFIVHERYNTMPVLIANGITKEMCFDIINEAGILLPLAYRLGYPNANCIGCVKATSATYWNHVRKMHPVIFKERAQQSRELGVRLVRYKGERLFLDELPVDAIGNKMKSYECGLFCVKN